MKRQEALELAKDRIPKISDWLSMTKHEKDQYCPLNVECEICAALFRRCYGGMFIDCPCGVYSTKYVTRRIFQLAKEQGIDLRKEVKPN